MWFTYLLIALLSSTVTVLAAEQATPNEDVVPGAFIVEYEDAQAPDDFLHDLAAVDVSAVSRMALSYSLFQGLSIRVDNVSDPDTTADTIGRLPKVKRVWPVGISYLPDDEVVWVGDEQTAQMAGLTKRSKGPDAFSPHVMTQVDKLQAAGYTGRGIKIGVLDSGVDYNHPALGGCFGPGCLISRGVDLVGNAYNGSNTPVPDDDPMEPCATSGHGTHVVGTIMAQENPLGFTGAAPDADVAVYKVFGCGGGVAHDVLIAAFNRAYEDGNDIITASIGSSSGWSENPIAVAVQRIVEAGVPVTVAAGNEGSQGMFFAGSGAAGKGVTAVGSVENVVTSFIATRAIFQVENVTEDFGWVEGYPTFGNLSLPLYATSNTSVTDDACEPLRSDTPDLSGYIVLVQQASCLISEQGRNVADKGGRYILVSGGKDGLVRPYYNDVQEILSGGGVSRDQGMTWVEMLNDGKQVVLTMTAPAVSDITIIEDNNVRDGGLSSSSTTWGPTWDLNIKPEIATVGGGILSTYPLGSGGYAVQSGTSMATPLAAAIYALLAQARGTRDPVELLKAISSTAQPALWAPDQSAGLAPVAQQGAGLVQAYDAAQVKTLLSVANLVFNDTDHMESRVSFTLQNLDKSQMTYRIGHTPAVTVYTFGSDKQPTRYPNPVAPGYAKLAFGESEFTVPAGGSIDVTVLPSQPEGLDASRIPVYSGYITINGTQEDATDPRVETLRLPYLGVAGSMKGISQLDSSLFSMTNLTQAIMPVTPNGTFYLPYPTDYSTPSDRGIGWPFLQFRPKMGSRHLRLDLVTDGPGHETKHTVDEFGVRVVGSAHGYPRELSSRTPSTLTFNGMLDDGSVAPEGRYHLLARALRIFGDPAKEEDWDVRAFDTFNLVYMDKPSA